MSYMLGSDRAQKKSANKSQFTLQIEEVNTLRKQNKQLLKKINILERMLDLFKKRSTL